MRWGSYLKPYHYVPHLLPRRSYFTKYGESRKENKRDDGLKNSDGCSNDGDGRAGDSANLGGGEDGKIGWFSSLVFSPDMFLMP